jgi:hypothetical protein
VPEPFALQRIGSDELIAKDVFKDVGHDGARSAPWGNRYAINAFIGPQSNDAHFAIRWTASQAVSPNEGGIRSWREDIEGFNARYAHRGPPTKVAFSGENARNSARPNLISRSPASSALIKMLPQT